jgi:hypothetical protein
MVDLCSLALTLFTDPRVLLGGAGLGIAAKLLYSYSGFSFWPSFLALSTVLRLTGSLASIATFILRSNILLGAAIITTFSGTLKALLSGNFTSTWDLINIILTDLYDKLGLVVQHIAEGIGYTSEYVNLFLSEGTCTALNSTEILTGALLSFWFALSAYIFALRLYDWMFGKGMTREVEWPETMLVVGVVTLFSVVLVGSGMVWEAFTQGEELWKVVQNQSQFNNTLNNTVNESVNSTQ